MTKLSLKEFGRGIGRRGCIDPQLHQNVDWNATCELADESFQESSPLDSNLLWDFLVAAQQRKPFKFR